MSKFCTKCGRPIPEGGICSCQLQGGQPKSMNQSGGQPNPSQRNNQIPPNQVYGNGQIPPNQVYGNGQIPPSQAYGSSQPNPSQGNSQIPPNQVYGNGQGLPNAYGSGQVPNQQYKAQASAFAQNFFGKVLNLVKSPVTEGRALILEADIKASLLLIVFQGIFSALFAMAAAGKLSQYIKAASGLAEGISSGMGNVVAGALSMPYVRIFLVTVLFSMGMACILALLLMLGHKALGIPVSFQQVLSAAAIRSAVLVPAILLSIVIFELSAGVGIALFALINIWGFFSMLVAMSAFIHPEKMNLFVLMVSIAALLFVFITMFAISQIWTLYLPDLVRTALKGAGDLSLGRIFQEMLGDLY